MENSKRIITVSLVVAALAGAGGALIAESVFGGGNGRVVRQTIEGFRVSDVHSPGDSSARLLEDPGFTREVDSNSGAVHVPELVSGLGVVPGLIEVEGIVEWDEGEFHLDGRELDMGPESWLRRTLATGDLDGDARVDDWWSELVSLLGRTITVLGDVDDDDIDVFEINDLPLRPLYSEIAPWSDEWNGLDVPEEIREVLANGLSAEEAVQRALEQVSGVVTDIQIDINDGHPYWEIDVRSPSGEIYDVELDAMTGRIVEIDPN